MLASVTNYLFGAGEAEQEKTTSEETVVPVEKSANDSDWVVVDLPGKWSRLNYCSQDQMDKCLNLKFLN